MTYFWLLHVHVTICKYLYPICILDLHDNQVEWCLLILILDSLFYVHVHVCNQYSGMTLLWYRYYNFFKVSFFNYCQIHNLLYMYRLNWVSFACNSGFDQLKKTYTRIVLAWHMITVFPQNPATLKMLLPSKSHCMVKGRPLYIMCIHYKYV